METLTVDEETYRRLQMERTPRLGGLPVELHVETRYVITFKKNEAPQKQGKRTKKRKAASRLSLIPDWIDLSLSDRMFEVAQLMAEMPQMKRSGYAVNKAVTAYIIEHTDHDASSCSSALRDLERKGALIIDNSATQGDLLP